MPTPDGCDDPVWVGLPDERSRIQIMLLDEAIDGGLQIDNGVEHAVFRRLRVSLAKKPSTALSHEQDVGTK